MTDKTRAIEQLDKLERNIFNLRQAIDSLPELGIGCYLWCTQTDIRIHIPYDFAVLKRTRAALRKEWRYISQFNGSDGDMLRHYTNGKVGLIITLVVTDKNSVCHRVQTGTREEPVYKVICQ